MRGAVIIHGPSGFNQARVESLFAKICNCGISCCVNSGFDSPSTVVRRVASTRVK